MSFAFAQHLEDFGQSPAFAHLPMISEPVHEGTDMMSDQPSIDIDAEKAAAYQEGYDAAMRAASEQNEAQNSAREATHKNELDQLEAQLGENLISQLASSIETQVTNASEQITDEVGRVLTQLFSTELIERSLDLLKNLINQALTENSASKIRLEGPVNLTERVKEKLGSEYSNIEIVDSDNVDIKIEVDQTIIATKIADWQKLFGSETP